MAIINEYVGLRHIEIISYYETWEMSRNRGNTYNNMYVEIL